jgi:hypothetical protein
MQTFSNEIGMDLSPIAERIGRIEGEQRVQAAGMRQFMKDLGRLEDEQKDLRETQREDRKVCAGEIDEIKNRINRAILWLAVAASGILLGLVRTKLGL